MPMPKIPIPKIKTEGIKSLYNIFNTFFSMRDLEKEFREAIIIEVFGKSEKANEFSRYLTGNTGLADAPDDKEASERIEKSSLCLFVLEASEITTGGLADAISAISSGVKKKCFFFIFENNDPNLKISTDAYLQSIGLPRALWISHFQGIIKFIIKKLDKKALPAARIYPGLRNELAMQYILKTSKENASLAFVASIPATIPAIGTIISLFAAAGDSLVITANQIRMCLRIAGIYGFGIDFASRMMELWPVIAGSFGWKSLAKSLVGLIPGFGAVLKASVAYGGTYVTGVAAQVYYRDGKMMTTKELGNIFNRSKKAFFEKISRKKKTPAQLPQDVLSEFSQEKPYSDEKSDNKL